MATKTRKTALPKSKAKNAYDLLTDVRKVILAEPLRYDQRIYIARLGGLSVYRRFPSCGTIACVAGWTAMLTHPSSKDVYATAVSALGLTSAEQIAELFGSAGAKGVPQTVEHAKSGSAHIARFQKKYAAQLKAKRV